MKVSELIAELLKQDQNKDVVADVWYADDIREAAEHLEKLTDEQCQKIIQYLERNPNSEYGINNERIIDIVDNLIESGEIDFDYTI
ncbi:hypothetical protein XaC1_28 [Xanthomonas phage XaC1]|nr:hypothetical protein XaC1_28 [Xanthomonas phage XaC1]